MRGGFLRVPALLRYMRFIDVKRKKKIIIRNGDKAILLTSKETLQLRLCIEDPAFVEEVREGLRLGLGVLQKRHTCAISAAVIQVGKFSRSLCYQSRVVFLAA
ncbi:hypothetical protein CDAR_593881 [Caerostris darwini]|uniref:Uncharacterized protein n=1 Tax=Caerostris darwini TaxID=1538125 RepID=A0AAV4RMQ6_9ARAC|nr:hypothetical protein CDAR_593881 [Caerostris darwini]